MTGRLGTGRGRGVALAAVGCALLLPGAAAEQPWWAVHGWWRESWGWPAPWRWEGREVAGGPAELFVQPPAVFAPPPLFVAPPPVVLGAPAALPPAVPPSPGPEPDLAPAAPPPVLLAPSADLAGPPPPLPEVARPSALTTEHRSLHAAAHKRARRLRDPRPVLADPGPGDVPLPPYHGGPSGPAGRPAFWGGFGVEEFHGN